MRGRTGLRVPSCNSYPPTVVARETECLQIGLSHHVVARIAHELGVRSHMCRSCFVDPLTTTVPPDQQSRHASPRRYGRECKAPCQNVDRCEMGTYDPRWLRIKRPTVVVGGELTLDGLEIHHDPRSNISEAPLQMKSNCGCLLIDDFGRQRIAPAELLNRWIVPLENRHDFLTLSTGKKIQVPFEQLIIFSTNLEPSELVDEAFLRRIPYKIEISDPDEDEFHHLCEMFAATTGFEYDSAAVEHLLERHYRHFNRAMRRCHPRDLMQQIRNLCTYQDAPLEMRPEHFDRAAASYFAMVAPKRK